MTLEQALLEKVPSLSPEKQQELLDFAEFLVQKSQARTELQKTSSNKIPQSTDEVDEQGWPLSYFERIYGICADNPSCDCQ